MPKRLSLETFTPHARPAGAVELIVNADHFRQIVVEGILQARISVDISTADFKAMLVPIGKAAVLRPAFSFAAAAVPVRATFRPVTPPPARCRWP